MPCYEGALEARMDPVITEKYKGKSHWLCVASPGDPDYNAARIAHRAKGLPIASWDMGYLGRFKESRLCYMRVALNGDHPSHKAMEYTEPDPSRWLSLKISLRDDFNPNGHVLVVGLGRKARKYLNETTWEMKTLEAMVKRFPDKRIVYRPKPNKQEPFDGIVWPDVMTNTLPIEQALGGASLVVCRHSNVAVDACIAGIPVECEAGAAHWLYSQGPEPTVEQRLDFLQRLCWWQYQLNPRDMCNAWKFLLKMEQKLREL